MLPLPSKLSDGGHEARRLEQERDATVRRCSAWLGIVRFILLFPEMLRYSLTEPLRAISANKNYVANKERNPYGQKEKTANSRRSLTDINALAVRKSDRRRLRNVLDGYVVSRGSVRPESSLERDVIINPDARNVHQWKDKEPP